MQKPYLHERHNLKLKVILFSFLVFPAEKLKIIGRQILSPRIKGPIQLGQLRGLIKRYWTLFMYIWATKSTSNGII